MTFYAEVLALLQQEACQSQESIARQLGVTLRTSQRHLEGLIAEGYVRVKKRRGSPFVYDLNPGVGQPVPGDLLVALMQLAPEKHEDARAALAAVARQ